MMIISFVKKTMDFLLLAVAIFSGTGALGKDQSVYNKSTPAKILMEFTGAADEPTWTAVNDGVMGGLSKGGAKIKDGLLHFSGTLSLENDGGFSSVSAEKLSLDFSANKYMILRVKGDGRTISFVLAPTRVSGDQELTIMLSFRRR